eukprot:CAMPEP_0172518064 /NCGR_PEP_ID=MMETSP1066-20121228/290212_1 /TAXON_ID=671091 /ORGANISM="Coscinodiscus wailesii, Strain CCMP2513" /LENGTH=78 /DNA_ID=CAMNT_0013300357 /DNA_START=230 /DNA_END=465 /DNA_ORIENTATION=+
MAAQEVLKLAYADTDTPLGYILTGPKNEEEDVKEIYVDKTERRGSFVGHLVNKTKEMMMDLDSETVTKVRDGTKPPYY